ncbi:MAG: hypothetical protein PHW73_03430 [Atribacterota bacterium]|nr:hypothetical protein [Atribacterota bacterium]
MDPNYGKNLFFIIGLVGAVLALVGYWGTWYFGRQVEDFAPYMQKIRTATATVEVSILSEENIYTHYMDRGGHIAFKKNDQTLLTMSSTECTAKQTGEGKVIYSSIFNMDAKDKAVNEPVYFIKDSDYVQIEFVPMPEKIKVLSGEAICTFNNNVRIEITILPQETIEKIIFVYDLENVFSEFEKVK